jgi:hypothetical protein
VENFSDRISVVFPPPFTSIPPQIHHQKTTICTTFFAKPLQKHHLTTAEKNNSKAEALPSFFRFEVV